MIYPLKSGWRVLDVGANVGHWTAAAVAQGATVVACEPLPQYRDAIASAGAKTVLTVAVSDIDYYTHLHVPRDDRFSSVTEEWPTEATQTFGWGNHPVAALRVNTMRLDRIILDYGPFDFIKIDTEGHEAAVMRSLGGNKPHRLSLEYHGHLNALKACRGVTQEAIGLLGTGYRYRFAAESTFWVSDWIGLDVAVDMLTNLDWGDVYAERNDV